MKKYSISVYMASVLVSTGQLPQSAFDDAEAGNIAAQQYVMSVLDTYRVSTNAEKAQETRRRAERQAEQQAGIG
jgi:hypothetical protein